LRFIENEEEGKRAGGSEYESARERYSVKRSLIQCQKRPTTVSKET
jgi:hypothetical protein